MDYLITNQKICDIVKELWFNNRYTKLIEEAEKSGDIEYAKLAKSKLLGFQDALHELNGKIGQIINQACIDCYDNGKKDERCLKGTCNFYKNSPNYTQ